MSSFLLLVHGDFGDAVAHVLDQLGVIARVASLHGSPSVLHELTTDVGFVGVASGRREHIACSNLDEVCAATRTPWSSVHLHGAELVGGPAIVPGHGPCYACYRRRWLTHSPLVDRERAFDDAVFAAPDLGTRGSLPGLALAGAAQLLGDRCDGAAAAGRLRWLDVLSGEVTESRVVAVSGCARCGSVAGDDRYTRVLRPALSEIIG